MGQTNTTLSLEEFNEIFQQLKNGLDSVALSLSEEDGEVLEELFKRLQL